MPINKTETLAHIARMLVVKAEDELMDLVEDVMEAEGVKPTSARMDQIETDLLREVVKAMEARITENEAKHQAAPRPDGF